MTTPLIAPKRPDLIPAPTVTSKQALTLEDTLSSITTLQAQPIRLGIQGGPGEGKTFAALTFPEPVVLNFDNKLSGYHSLYPDKDIKIVNFTRNLCVQLGALNGPNGKVDKEEWQPNVRDALIKWLTKFGPLLEPGTTLIEDSWTSYQNKLDYQLDLPHELSYSKSGEVDKFYFWRMKQKYSKDVMDLLKDLRCNVVITMHETVERDDDGRATGKVRPLMQGGYADQIAAQLTDHYRQICVTRDLKNYDAVKKALGRDINGEREWVWQTQSNGIFTACCSIPNMPAFVPARYESLTKKY